MANGKDFMNMGNDELAYDINRYEQKRPRQGANRGHNPASNRGNMMSQRRGMIDELKSRASNAPWSAPESYKKGGKVTGSHGLAHKGEYVLKASAAKKIGTRALNQMNKTGRPPGARKR